MTKLLRIFLLTALLVVSNISSANAQGSPSERYHCPQQREVKQDRPFTREAVEVILGFSDPSLNNIVNIAADSFSFPSVEYRLNLSCTPQDDSTFVALLYFTNGLEMRLQVFQLRGSVVVDESHLDLMLNWMPYCTSVSGFSDRNFNGLPDLFVSGCDGSAKGWYSGLRIIELGQDDILRDITPVGGDIGPDGFDDIDDDGIPEIYNAQYFFVPTFPNYSVAVQRLNQWWDWNSLGARTTAVQVFLADFSPPTTDELDSGTEIAAYLNGLTDAKICTEVEQETRDIGYIRWNLFHILMYYHAWGDLPAGWTRIHPVLLAADKCTDSDGKHVFFGALGKFEAYFTTP